MLCRLNLLILYLETPLKPTCWEIGESEWRIATPLVIVTHAQYLLVVYKSSRILLFFDLAMYTP